MNIPMNCLRIFELFLSIAKLFTRTHHNERCTRIVYLFINLLAPELFFFYFNTPFIYNGNNTGTKHVRIMKQTAF